MSLDADKKTEATVKNSEHGSLAGKYLTFKLVQEEYGLQILKVQEIIGMMDVTKVPKTPDFVRGVINLRGRVIPVADLRRKFSFDHQEDTEKTCIIVVQVCSSQDSKETTTMGILVDEVSEVLDIVSEQIEKTPSLGSGIDTDFILGMGKVEDKVVMLLDIDKVLTGMEVKVMENVGQTSAA